MRHQSQQIYIANTNFHKLSQYKYQDDVETNIRTGVDSPALAPRTVPVPSLTGPQV